MSDENKHWMESWEKYCPDYKIVRWDESNYDVTQNKYMRQDDMDLRQITLVWT